MLSPIPLSMSGDSKGVNAVLLFFIKTEAPLYVLPEPFLWEMFLPILGIELFDSGYREVATLEVLCVDLGLCLFAVCWERCLSAGSSRFRGHSCGSVALPGNRHRAGIFYFGA